MICINLIIYSRCQKKLFLLIKKELKIFFNKNESNQNVVTIHSLHLAFSTFTDSAALNDSTALTDSAALTEKKNIDPFLGNFFATPDFVSRTLYNIKASW